MLRSSRYQFSTAQLDGEGRLFLSRAEPFGYAQLDDNVLHEVKQGDSLWSLAARYYTEEPRGAGYWWAIAAFQPEPVCHDPTVALTPGSVIVVPSLLTLRSRILNGRRRRAGE